MTYEQIAEGLRSAKSVFGYMYGKQYVIDSSSRRLYADRLIDINVSEIEIYPDKFVYTWGWPGPDYNIYRFMDYGKTWAFTREEIESNPYPNKCGAE